MRLSRPRFIEQNKQTRCESLTIYIPHLRYCICDLRTHTYIHIFTYTHMDRISTPTSQLLGRLSCPILQEASELRSGMSQMHISPSRITPARKSLRGHTHNRVPVPIASHVSTTIFSCTREHCLHTKCKYSIRCTMYTPLPFATLSFWDDVTQRSLALRSESSFLAGERWRGGSAYSCWSAAITSRCRAEHVRRRCGNERRETTYPYVLYT